MQLRSLSEDVFILGSSNNVGFVEDYEGQVVSFLGKSISIKDKEQYWIVEAEAGVVSSPGRKTDQFRHSGIRKLGVSRC